MIEEPGTGVQSFSADIAIPSELRLPAKARIYVEAYVKSSLMRFHFGTIAEPVLTATHRLTDIDLGPPVLFRVKVVDDPESVGKILAAAMGIKPENDTERPGRKSLLPLKGMDLDEEIWRLDINKDAGPTLCISNRIPGLFEGFPSNATLMAVIFPEVVRQLTRRLFDHPTEFDDDAEWVVDWKDFLCESYGSPISVEDDELDQMADDVASNFSRRQQFASRLSIASGAGA